MESIRRLGRPSNVFRAVGKWTGRSVHAMTGGAPALASAGASAWATGVRTYNGAISVDVDSFRKPLINSLHKSFISGDLRNSCQCTADLPSMVGRVDAALGKTRARFDEDTTDQIRERLRCFMIILAIFSA